jgi:hypothetical protein
MRAREFLREYSREKIREGWLSTLRDKANASAKEFDFKESDRYLDILINKAKSNNINGLDVITALSWYSILEAVAHTKDQKLDRLFNEIWMNLEHWPKNNTDVQRSKNLIDQLTALREHLKMFSTDQETTR